MYVTALKKSLSEDIRKIIFPDNVLVPYSELMDSIIDYCEAVPEQEEELLRMIIKAEEGILDNRFLLRESLGWCGIVTSLMSQLPGFSDLRSVLNRVDMKNPYITYLFGKAGSESRNIPITFGAKMSAKANKNEFWNKITTRIKMSGILVIDGWNPSNDWLTVDDLNALISFSKKVYIFLEPRKT